jgi:hypothetical protein
MAFQEEETTTDFSPVYDYLGISAKRKVKEYVQQHSYNEYEFVDTSGNTNRCFKKFITLVDYVKYLIGKYKNENVVVLPAALDARPPTSPFQDLIHSPHNYAFVDSFFYSLTSILKEEHGFVHGISLYDSYICIKKNYQIDVADDFEYIGDSNYFTEKMNKLFYFKNENFMTMFNNENEPSGRVLTLEETQEVVDLDDPPPFGEEETPTIEPSHTLEMVTLDEVDDLLFCDEVGHDDLSDDDDSAISLTDSEDEDHLNDHHHDNGILMNGSEDIMTNDLEKIQLDDDDDDDHTRELSVDESDGYSTTNSVVDGDDESNELILVIKEIPTQVIAIEKCVGTFDSLLERNNMTIEELESAMFQVVVMLYTYQTMFKFTHNDLHTNNIMYVETTDPYLYYCIQKKYYKVPTFGRIYKIIDFGRAIYTVNDKLLCSDSFSENGMAHTQYNFEPFYNSKKPVIEPNYSFDLCRLACSMLDFIIEDLKDIQTFRSVPVYDMIISWVYDDMGNNILYKRNGEERYPDFKLYKMIARIVHHHTPERQFAHPCFQKFQSPKKKVNIKKVIDLDKIQQVKV